MVVRIDCTPFTVPGKIDKQSVQFSVNGTRRINAVVSNRTTIAIPLLRTDLNKDGVLISMSLPNAVSPLKMEFNDDSRDIALALHSLVIKSVPGIVSGVEYDMQDDQWEYAFSRGWSAREQGHRWTEGNLASIGIIADVDSKGGLDCKMLLNPFIVKGVLDAQIVDVSINGKFMARWRLDRRDWYSVSIPSDVRTGFIRIIMKIQTAASPSHFGLSGDQRMLGVSLERIKFEQET